jgi:hypothetical protein
MGDILLLWGLAACGAFGFLDSRVVSPVLLGKSC